MLINLASTQFNLRREHHKGCSSQKNESINEPARRITRKHKATRMAEVSRLWLRLAILVKHGVQEDIMAKLNPLIPCSYKVLSGLAYLYNLFISGRVFELFYKLKYGNVLI